MAIYDQPKDVDTRVRFFDGQYLIDQDFVDEQKYHLDRERRLGKLLRITGIAEGLAVASSAGQPNKVTIAPGTAIDSDGRQIVLAKERTLDLPAAAFNNKSAIKLYIVYRELETEKAKVGSEGARRFYENPLIAAVAADGTSTDTWDSTLTPVLLAQLNVSSNGAVAVDPSVLPQYAGLSLRGNVGIGTATPGAKLHVSGGQIQVDGNQKIVFTDTDVTNNLKLQLWSGYGLGINGSTLFYAASGNHSWRDINGTNERMLLTTAANGGLTVKGTGASSFAGNLGIGTPSPGDYKLSVNGSSRLGGITDFASNTVLSVAPGTIQFDAPGVAGGRFSINGSTGNVGIGTISPAAKLEVTGSGGSNVDFIVNGRMRSNNNDGGLWIGTDRLVGGHSTNQLGFYNGGAWRLSVLTSGNIGIGTTNAEDALQISDFAAGDRYVTLTTQGGNKHRTGIKLWAWQKNYGFKIEHDETINGLNITRHATGAQPDVAGTTALFIANFTGNVGIGTASPAARLEVTGGGGSTVDLIVNGRLRSNNNDGGLWVAADRFIGGHSTDRMGFWNGDAWRLTVLKNGNVGIGTTNPNLGKLHIQDGNIYCSGTIYAQGGLSFWWGPDGAWKGLDNRAGSLAGTVNYGAPSDLRLKTELHPIRDALEKVLRLGGVSYHWSETGLAHFTRNLAHLVSAGPNATEEENQQLWAAEREKARQALAGDNIGLIAQDVETVVPEVVHEDEQGYKHIRYQHLTALLIEAIKEQHALIQALADKVTALAAV